MKAAVYERYGPPEVVEVRDVPAPTPGDGDVLVKIHATTVTAGDWRMRSLDVPAGFRLVSRLIFGIRRPRKRILGIELSGEVEAVGNAVRRFKPGDQVFGIDGARMGCHAEYKCIPESAALALKPTTLSHDEAAGLCFGGITALHFLGKARLQKGEKVLVNGASGSVGTAAVQIARHLGARVTGVCSSANVDLVRSLGAAEVIDYTSQDLTQNGETYDVIMDTAGTAPFSRARGSLARGGRLLVVLGGLADMVGAPWRSLTSHVTIVSGVAAERAEDVRLLARLAEAGDYRAVIDRRYRLDEIVEAHRHVDTGHKKGNVVVTVTSRD